jgi:YVTN family beta-propeller protein
MRLVALLLGIASVAAPVAGAQRSGPDGSVVVSNMNDNTATVLDAATGRTVATLPTGQAPHEVAISHDGRWAVVSNYGVRGKPGSTLTVIDIRAAGVTRTVDLHEYQKPHGMVFLPGDSLLAVTSEASKAILIVDFRNGVVVRSIPSGGRTTHMVALSQRGDRMVMSNIADGTITSLDPWHAEGAQVIHVAAQPEGIAITPDGRFAFSGSDRDSVVVVVDLGHAATVDTLRGFGLPYRLAVSPDGRRLVVTDPMLARVRIFDVASRREQHAIDIPRDSIVSTAEVPGSPSPEGVTISRDSRWAFVTLQGRNRLATIDLERGVVVSLAPIGTWSDGVGYSPLGRTP